MSKKPPRIGDVVEVMWVDSEQISIGWAAVAEYLDAAHHRSAYRTAGYWLIGDESVVAIALSMDPFNGHVTHVMSIPKCAVTHIQVLGRSNARVRKALTA